MEKKYPFKFLNSYGQEDRDIFFGREEEIETLYEMVFEEPILLVYGASGTGKTSLIQCGLASRFKSYDWLALNIRRGSNLNDSLEKALKEHGDSELSDNASSDNNPGTKATSLQQLIKSVYLNNFKPIYLIFDQFEELYILGNKDEQKKFIDSIKEILHAGQPVKVIISIREEYLGHLFEFEKEVPQLLHKKLRVEPMGLDKVKTVIKNIAQAKHSVVSIEPGAEEIIAESIFEKLRGEENTFSIQLPYLQVFLDRLYQDITHDPTQKSEAKFTMAAINKMPGIGDVLRNFLDEQVLIAANDLKQKPEDIWKILSPFVTLEGTKKPLSAEELCTLIPNENELIIKALKIFEDRRILRYLEKDMLYEIAHDSLALQVKAKQSADVVKILEAEQLITSRFALKNKFHKLIPPDELVFIEPYLNNIKLDDNEKAFIAESKRARDRKKRLKTFSQILIFAAISVGLIYSIYRNYRNREIHDLDDREEAIQDIIRFANSNNVLALANAEKDPTLALQLEKKALDTLEMAGRLCDTLSGKSYKYIDSEKSIRGQFLDSLYKATFANISAQSMKLVETRQCII